MIGYEWLAKFVTLAILLGLSSVMLVLLMAQSRICYSMSKDNLLPPLFSDIHPRFKTPYKSNILLALFVGLLSALLPADLIGNMTSIGTLFAFILVCMGIILLRKDQNSSPSNKGIDDRPGFQTPWVPLIPLLGIITCGIMIYGLGYLNWIRLVIWMAIGLVIYFSYPRRESDTSCSQESR
jgi:APA family basic amino acid/polyamine antiporter